MLTTGESACHAKIVGTWGKRQDKTLLMKRGEVFVNSETKRVHIRTVVTKVFHNTWFLALSQCFLNFRFLVLLVLLVCFPVRSSHAWTQPKGISIIKSPALLLWHDWMAFIVILITSCLVGWFKKQLQFFVVIGTKDLISCFQVLGPNCLWIKRIAFNAFCIRGTISTEPDYGDTK